MTMHEPEGMKHTAQFRAAIDAGDYMGMWRIMAGAFPTAPQPKTPEQAEIILHRIRVETESVSDRKRCYSHAWLNERNYPSGLPDRLLAKAMRLYPSVIDTVGIAVRMPTIFQEVACEVEGAMSDAVMELHEDGVNLNDRPVVHKHIFAARKQTIKTLLGTTTKPLRDYK